MVDDDDGDRFPSPEPRTDCRSALPREFRAWQRLRIVKRDESFYLIFVSLNTNILSFDEKKTREKKSSRFTIRSRRQALKPLGRADLESVRGSGEGDSSLSSSSTILHHQFHDAHRRA